MNTTQHRGGLLRRLRPDLVPTAPPPPVDTRPLWVRLAAEKRLPAKDLRAA